MLICKSCVYRLERGLLSMVEEVYVCRRDLQCLLTSKVFDGDRTKVAEVFCYRINGWLLA